jgi:hypothetical protein
MKLNLDLNKLDVLELMKTNVNLARERGYNSVYKH